MAMEKKLLLLELVLVPVLVLVLVLVPVLEMLVLEPCAGLALANSFQLNDFISTTRATFATDALDIEHPH